MDDHGSVGMRTELRNRSEGRRAMAVGYTIMGKWVQRMARGCKKKDDSIQISETHSSSSSKSPSMGDDKSFGNNRSNK